MKKVFTLIAAVAMITSLSSCKKDWDCKCSSKDSSNSSYSASSTVSFTATKKDAEDSCTAFETTVGTISTSCELSKK